MSQEDALTRARHHYAAYLTAMGEAPGEETATARRVVGLMHEWTRGRREARPSMSVFDAPSSASGAPSTDWVGLSGLQFYSFCEHHMVPFFGEVEVAFLPSDRIIGFSAVARLLDHVSRRPQLQERLAREFAEGLSEALAPRGLFVRLRARQLCMEMRGHPAPARCVSVVSQGHCQEPAGLQAALAVLASPA